MFAEIYTLYWQYKCLSKVMFVGSESKKPLPKINGKEFQIGRMAIKIVSIGMHVSNPCSACIKKIV